MMMIVRYACCYWLRLWKSLNYTHILLRRLFASGFSGVVEAETARLINYVSAIITVLAFCDNTLVAYLKELHSTLNHQSCNLTALVTVDIHDS